MKFRVTSIGIDATVEPFHILPPHLVVEPRVEDVDTESNQLFADCKNIRDLEIQYEDFWNFLYSDTALHSPCEKVKVLTVQLLS